MKAYTNDTHGRNYYFYGKKEHKVPKKQKIDGGRDQELGKKIKKLLIKDLFGVKV